MALTAAQIVTLACQAAHVPGWTSQAGNLLNYILSDLCQTYDFDTTRKVGAITLTASAPPVFYGPASWQGMGVGPIALPADYLRACDEKSVFYTVNAVPYHLVPIDLTEFDELVQQAGINNFPTCYATDTSAAAVAAVGSPVIYAWPPPNGAYVTAVRYYSTMPDIATPQTSGVIPWFPNQNYLITRLTGELMKLSDDTRASAFLGEGGIGAEGILTKYLKLKDDSSSRAQTVRLDRRRFGNSEATLRNTKLIGW
jgi:hypothetical protein